MSRVARRPVALPKGVEIAREGESVRVKGPKGEMRLPISPHVELEVTDGQAQVSARSAEKQARAMAGTTRALLNNMVDGVSKGFERKLELVGVGYRAQSQGRTLNLTLGLSHPVAYSVPEGISIDTPSQTEIVVKGTDKRQVGQVAADIRRFRPPEPYKGKGIRYSDEKVVLKEAKKK